jgi:hypothetical protein
MEVKVIPMSGCMMLILGVFTLGVAPIGIKLNERNWPKLLDEQGLVTRGGKRIEWSEFTKFQKVITRVQGTTTERFDLHSPKGIVAVVVYRLQEGDQVLEYIWQRLPESAKSAQQ